MTEYIHITNVKELHSEQKVRMTHRDESILYGTVHGSNNGTRIRTSATTDLAVNWAERGWRIDAEPMVFMPAGMYIHREALDVNWADSKPTVLFHDGQGDWSYQGHNYERDVAMRDAKSWGEAGDLIRLVPEILIQEIRAYLVYNGHASAVSDFDQLVKDYS